MLIRSLHSVIARWESVIIPNTIQRHAVECFLLCGVIFCIYLFQPLTLKHFIMVEQWLGIFQLEITAPHTFHSLTCLWSLFGASAVNVVCRCILLIFLLEWKQLNHIVNVRCSACDNVRLAFHALHSHVHQKRMFAVSQISETTFTKWFACVTIGMSCRLITRELSI